MKLKDVLLEQEEKGTYAAVRFGDDTKDNIESFINDNEIPNSVPRDKLHTTLLYSRKYCPDYSPPGNLEQPLEGTPTEFDVWKSQPDEEGNRSNCLVMKYDCEDLVNRHNELMDEHGATFDFDEYRPHVTLSYDIGDMSIDNLNPDSIGPINVVEEYGEDLNMNWAKENT